MKMDKVASSGNDEFYTPYYAIEPLLKYLRSGSKVWCPFDTDESLFVVALKKNGFKVVNTHIDYGECFFETNIDDCDYIISNPPYSIKTDVLERLFYLNKPFAMLLGVVGLFESQKRFEMFRDNDFEVMYMNRRVDYFKSYREKKPSKNPPFSSVYITKNILPRKIVFEEINKKNLTV